eukprot:TRINITY_DN3773_c0_g1_i1.p1 TRINITY_DN3773_c0_g1~~TRINITY_DN3773_c0_g1_i1.p1  ORF type:complete len:129 (+),score=39.78 TRINITY_DN3773_c0_g1_i1:131-517(+)
MFDGSDETCWNSNPTTPQWILIDFERAVKVEKILITFQGGFSAQSINVMKDEGEDKWEEVQEFHPEDKNLTQTFVLKEPVSLTKLKLHFPTSTDMFGRIVIYKLDVIGEDSNHISRWVLCTINQCDER